MRYSWVASLEHAKTDGKRPSRTADIQFATVSHHGAADGVYCQYLDDGTALQGRLLGEVGRPEDGAAPLDRDGGASSFAHQAKSSLV